MSTAQDFHFAILRISVAQILKANGIDRITPSMLDLMTDLYIRHLDLLATTCTKLSRNTPVTLHDAGLAMSLTGVLKPMRVYDEDENEEASLRFVEWAKESAANFQTVSKVVVPPQGPTLNPVKDKEKEEADQEPQKVKTEEWLQSLMKKQVKVGHEKRFNGTVLGSTEESGEIRIVGGPATLEDAFLSLN